MDDEKWMRLAIEEAKRAEELDEVPVGAVIVKDDQVVARAHNLKETSQMANAHAEMLAICRANEALGTWNLKDCDLYVTLEPCMMCMGAIVHARLRRVIYGTKDPKAGMVESVLDVNAIKQLNHHPELTSNVLQEECSALLTEFFRKKRALKKAEKQNKKEENENFEQNEQK